ncbi:MAG: GNAT family N-acetyltransferase [Candidatus Heimdallarchaeota archaeon]
MGYLGVLLSQRKRGIGTSIFKKLLEEAEKHNPTIELFSNLGADSIYRRCGFKEEFNAFILKLTKPDDATYENVERLSDSIPS